MLSRLEFLDTMRRTKSGDGPGKPSSDSEKQLESPLRIESENIAITLSKRSALTIFAAAVVAGGLVALATVLVMELRHGRPPAATDFGRDRDQIPAVPTRTNVPPWGELVEYDVEFEKPDEYITVPTGTNLTTRWFVGHSARREFEQLALSAGIPAGQVAALLDTNRCAAVSNGVWLFPGHELVFRLKPESRQLIYGKLAEFTENTDYMFPFCYRQDALDRWFKNSGLSSGTVELVGRFLYPRGRAMCFSDSAELMNRVPAAHERLRLLKTLWRQAGVVVKLRIRPESDIDRLMAYWGVGYHAKDFRPLLESMARLPDGGNLDIVHLLPPFARRRLYSYPPPPRNAVEANRDCHWTSMNFINEEPDDRFCNREFVIAKLTTDYAQIAQPGRLGDLIFWKDDEGVAIHSAVYIADDIVFTKNGANYMQPWTLMRIDDLLAAYPREEPMNMVCYRSKLR